MKADLQEKTAEVGVYAVQDFGGDPIAVERLLDELVKEEESFFKLREGMYHRSRWVKLLDRWAASDVAEVCRAIMRQTGEFITITDAVAANGLGLTTQVQAKIMYCTTGFPREIIAGDWNISLVAMSDVVRPFAGSMAQYIIQALHWQGQAVCEANKEEYIARLKKVPRSRLRCLEPDIDLAPEWMRPILREICREY